MARSFTYQFEDDDGNECEYEIAYRITKGYSGTWEQPPEPPEIEFESITQNGIEVGDIPDAMLCRIEELIWKEVESDEYDYDEDDDW